MGANARGRGLWLTLAALAAVLLVLAVLQYRWIGEIGRAEAERRQEALERTTSRFAVAIEAEVGRLMLAFRSVPAAAPSDHRAFLLERLAAWRRTEHAGLLSRVLLATRADSGEITLEACSADQGAFRREPWPVELEPMRQRLRATPGEAPLVRRGTPGGRGSPPSPGEPEGFLFRAGGALDWPPTLPLPLVDATEGPSQGAFRFRVNALAILVLDPTYLKDHLLPQLAEAHFGPLTESEFLVALLRRSDRSVLFSSDTGADLRAPAPGDVRVPLRSLAGRFVPGERRDQGRPPWFGGAPPDGRGRDAPPRPPEEGPLVLVARHRGGSLEKTVASIRRRNLAVGLGLLGLLGITGAILATGAQRARDLAGQRMELVAGVTHELNTPLAGIRSAGQNLADGIVTDPAQVRRYGGLIEKEGSRLTALVAQVLDFAGIEAGSRAYASEPVSLSTLVDDVLRDHRLVLEQAGMAVESEVASELPRVRGDAAALRSVLANLVANAVKFAAAGGWIAVRASAGPGGGTVVLRVEDRGPGIARDERERVFEPFYRGRAVRRNATPGNGLGLSLVRHVVRAHGGRVHVEGPAGGGTAVVVELPAIPAQEEPP